MEHFTEGAILHLVIGEGGEHHLETSDGEIIFQVVAFCDSDSSISSSVHNLLAGATDYFLEKIGLTLEIHELILNNGLVPFEGDAIMDHLHEVAEDVKEITFKVVAVEG